LVNNLLELVRLEADGITVENARFSLRQCIDEAVQVHIGAAHLKGLTIFQELPADLPTEVIGDKSRISQILHNLLGNAVKFTEQGVVTIRVSCEHAENGVLLTRFSVIDTGIGIESVNLENIFETFIQTDMSNTRKFGGLGLGLAICKRLTTAMGGRLWAESQFGNGSSFYFELPLEQKTADQAANDEQRQI